MGNNTDNTKSKDAQSQKLPMRFIAWIYRFTGNGPEGMVSVIEAVPNGEEKEFTGIQELGEILANSSKSNKRRKT